MSLTINGRYIPLAELLLSEGAIHYEAPPSPDQDEDESTMQGRSYYAP